RYGGRYRDELGRRTYLVNTTRGCPGRCTFCACWRAAGGRVLVRTPEDVARELETLPRGVRVFFADDHTFADAQRAEELCRRVQHENAGRRYTGYTRADTVVKHPELFAAWRRAGLKDITIGLEAASDAGLSKLGKGTSTKINEEAIRILHRLDITPFAQLLVDPDFDEDDFDALSEFVERTNLSHPLFVVLTPLPGTVLYEQQHSRINMPYEFFDFAHAIVPTRLSLDRFLVRFSNLYFDAYSLRRNLRQRLQRVGLLLAQGGDGSEFPRPVTLLMLAGWHVLARLLEGRLRRHYGLSVRR
ncbi:MAG: radical SAM protein, partial [Spirochaetia bacterium]